MKRLWHAWVELTSRREKPTALVLTRILVALAVLGDLVHAWSLDVVTAVWAPPPHGTGYASIWDPLPPFMVRWFGPGVDTAHLVFWIAVGAAVLLLVGAATRVSAVALALMLAQLGHMAPEGDRGIDFLLRTAVAVLALSSCHARFSLDAWVRRRLFKRPFPELVPAWPRYLLFAQVVWMYFSAGHNKGDAAWGPLRGFSALANILSDPHFARFDGGWIPYAMPLLAVGTATTVLFEWSSPLLPLLTWWQRTPEKPGRLRRIANKLRLRWVWIATGVFFHIGIAATMRLGVFPWGMLALYPVLFHPDELEGAARWLRARAARTATAVLLVFAACGGAAGTAPDRSTPPPAQHHEHAAAHGDHRFEKAEDWAALFDAPERAAWQKPDEVVGLLELAPGMTVVDIGAGTGYFLSRLSRAVGGKGRVVATDIEPDMVRYMKERAAREKLGNVEAVLSPGGDVGVPAGSADRALIVDVWHHINHRDRYAANLARALRPGGLVVIVDFTLESRRGPPRDHRLAPETVMAELRAGGLSAELARESLPDQYVVLGRLKGPLAK